ncbi:DUF1570 domain-containing protein [Pirellulaceae bacterium SH449]
MAFVWVNSRYRFYAECENTFEIGMPEFLLVEAETPKAALLVKQQSAAADDELNIQLDSINALLLENDGTYPVTKDNTPRITEIATPYGVYHGLPMARFLDQYWLLRSDGAIQSIPSSMVNSEHRMDVEFTIISPDQLVETLRAEFGSGYLVQIQKPYVFVSRSQHVGQWAAKFRALHDSMRRLCLQKGLNTTEIEFPLVAIVFGSRQEFIRYASRSNTELPPNCVGYYSQRDNRIALFEDTNEATTQETLDTIAHESAHQLAFNMGLHRRCVSSGLWLPEGFATVFEAPAYSHVSREGRSSWPAARIATWERIQNDVATISESLDSLVRNDNLFSHDPDLAYTLAWGMTHYFMEKEPRKFADYLYQTSQLPLGHELTATDRWHHFRSVFGREPAQFAPLIQRHINHLR